MSDVPVQVAGWCVVACYALLLRALHDLQLPLSLRIYSPSENVKLEALV